jgi:peptidyl-prolyl cis-trans isomerase D
MVPEFDKAIFGQKVGDIAVVKSSFGYHVIQVEERQSAHTKPLSEVQPEIVSALSREAAAQAEQHYAQQLVAEAAKDGMAKTAAAHHLALVTPQPLDRQAVIPALPDSAQLLGKVFTAKQGAVPQLAPTGEGYAIFQLTDITPAHAPAFADWKSHVLDDYRGEQLPTLLAQKTKDLSEKAKSMNDLVKAAKAVGASVKTSDLVGLADQVPDFGAVGQVAPQLFTLAVGAISGPINAGRTGVVARIVDKQEPSGDEIARNFDRTRQQILEQRKQEAFSVFMSGVWNDYKKHGRIRMNSDKDKNKQAATM